MQRRGVKPRVCTLVLPSVVMMMVSYGRPIARSGYFRVSVRPSMFAVPRSNEKRVSWAKEQPADG